MSKPNLENSYIQRTALNTEQDEQNIENSRLLAGNSSSNSDENRKLSPKGMSLKTPENEIPRKIRVYQGVFLSILSGVLFTANNFIIKHFNVVPGDAVLVRGLVQVLLLLGFSVSKNYQILPTESRIFCFVILQSVLGGLSFISALICVSLMPVADALVIMFSSPLATMAVAAIFLGERFNMLRIMMGLSILAGVTLVCKPPLVFPSFQIQNDTINGSSEEMFINSTEDVLKSTFLDLDDGTPEVVHDTTYWTGAGFAMAAVLTGTFHNITVPACKGYVGLRHFLGLALRLVQAGKPSAAARTSSLSVYLSKNQYFLKGTVNIISSSHPLKQECSEYRSSSLCWCSSNINICYISPVQFTVYDCYRFHCRGST
ncbi:uncharacterized protein LOC111711893 isoform X4 [Eurytemora carolleeae]|uniref:uncharacterized protein LOC111711893 isoform X4 n=1 Tax=Eurytemora carolleeae TaxID=1294199 RepID=UPI000C78C2DD|nr:uncharacterized protein LOC111711893 isoform X4 [Eurytemora carolleeae]|eukprot:XP_023342121.1 uncharacterized protein LOC111711893 isoform X4 [Eurytemora affinis]